MFLPRYLIVLIMALGLVAGCSADRPAGQENVLRSEATGSGLRLAAEMPKQRYVAGRDYYVTLSLTNLGDTSRSFDAGSLFGMSVVDAAGAVVWPDGTIPSLAESMPVTLAPGETHRQQFLLVVDEPGAYDVRCRIAGGALRWARSGRLVKSTPPELAVKPLTVRFEPGGAPRAAAEPARAE